LNAEKLKITMIELKVPSPGESITQVQLASWLVSDGDFVEKDQEVAEIDSDKATLSVSAEEDGQIKLLAEVGDTIDVGEVICTIDTSVKGEKKADIKEDEKAVALPKEEVSKETKPEVKAFKEETKESDLKTELNISPLARKLMQENNVSESDFVGFLKGFRFGKTDVEYFLSNKDNVSAGTTSSWGGTRDKENKKMSMLRMKLSERLVAVKNETAMLTTFNEVNMKPIMDIRKKYKEIFKEKHGVSLGFMSFFTKAVTEALHHYPQVNAQINGDEMIYHDYADIGIAVSSPKGLMVPVVRNAEQMSLAEIEAAIKELAGKARNGKITVDEMMGGTFTITNGGIFGSMLSTPIINPPQSAILGMHNIVERPVAVNGKVEIQTIMYIALLHFGINCPGNNITGCKLQSCIIFMH